MFEVVINDIPKTFEKHNEALEYANAKWLENNKTYDVLITNKESGNSIILQADPLI